MKKIFLILILIGCCFTSSFAQVEKFFSFEINANTKHFFPKNYKSGDRPLGTSVDKGNYEISFLPAFNIGRFKFNIGVSYSYSNYYYIPPSLFDSYRPSAVVSDYKINYINIPINVNFNIYKYDKIWFNCFLSGSLNMINNGARLFYSKDNPINTELIRDKSYKWKDFSLRLGVEVSLIAIKNLKINIAPFANYLIDNKFQLLSLPLTSASDTRVSFPRKFSLGLSVGLEYMFKFSKKN
ncbi:MAG: hypothetical protein LBM25_02455 [Bacteroidales bacterium]|jgi:hypothetical protein|nr:hypothetical protein [Bacteroidales bacterium]